MTSYICILFIRRHKNKLQPHVLWEIIILKFTGEWGMKVATDINHAARQQNVILSIIKQSIQRRWHYEWEFFTRSYNWFSFVQILCLKESGKKWDYVSSRSESAPLCIWELEHYHQTDSKWLKCSSWSNVIMKLSTYVGASVRDWNLTWKLCWNLQCISVLFCKTLSLLGTIAAC
jgi:hypothetical protein